MDVGYKNGYRRLEGFSELIQELKTLVKGFNETTGQYGGGGVDNISSKTDTISTNTDNIYNLLDERLLKRVVISRADYDNLAVKDPDTVYYVIESQSNNP